MLQWADRLKESSGKMKCVIARPDPLNDLNSFSKKRGGNLRGIIDAFNLRDD